MPELYEFNKILIKIKKRKTESLNKCEWDTWHLKKKKKSICTTIYNYILTQVNKKQRRFGKILLKIYIGDPFTYPTIILFFIVLL